MKISYAFAACVLLAVLCGCASAPRKMACIDIDVPKKYATELAIIQNPRLNVESEQKYLAAKVLKENIDFDFARNTADLEKIFNPMDARKAKVLDNDALIFQYSWRKQYVRFVFLGFGNSITSCEVKEGIQETSDK